MPSQSKDLLLGRIRTGEPLSVRERLTLIARLSIPAILANLSSIIMQFIDASMVGHLGADASASIGLVATTLWLFGGVCSGVSSGFSVQVAHMIGANRMSDARAIVRQAIPSCLIFALALAALGVMISGPMPVWLGGHEAILSDATAYFLIFSLSLPFFMLCGMGGGMLRAAGNVRVPSLLNILLCVLDVIFNYLLIFPTRDVSLLGMSMRMPGAGLGVVGAALGTALSFVVVSALMMGYLLFRSGDLRIHLDAERSYKPTREVLRKAVKISYPLCLQHALLCGALVIITAIVAPLGSVAIAANSFGVTAESICYMPGYGLGDAATTLVGQSYGARRRDLTRSFARLTTWLGIVTMGVMGVLMYVFAEEMMSLMTPVQDIVDLGTRCLRIEAWAEPFFGAAIVCYGAFVGAGDTLAPSAMNLLSMWVVRLTTALLLVGSMGLVGVWTAMCIELTFRGIIFFIRLESGKWYKAKS